MKVVVYLCCVGAYFVSHQQQQQRSINSVAQVQNINYGDNTEFRFVSVLPGQRMTD